MISLTPSHQKTPLNSYSFHKIVPSPFSTVPIIYQKIFSESDFLRINTLLQEMWSSENGLQELSQCDSCGEIFSKKDIFGYLDERLYELSVEEIMKILRRSDIHCLSCGDKTRLIHDSKRVDSLKKRLLESVNSFLVVAEQNDHMLGGLLWYLPKSFEEMYELEFKYHYSAIGVEKIKNKVTIILGSEPQDLIMFAAIGFLDKYRNLFQLMEFLQFAFSKSPKIYHGLPAIMELDKNNTMYKLFTSIGGISLELGENDNHTSGINNTGKNYRSDLVILPNAGEVFLKYFGPNVSRRLIFKQIQSLNSN
ncbi:hypothetical protein K2X92_03315 [Candidatus Gracilibacteria bacterium]|nr:hypothetical protein [Candidatus Gracilibacteria bacterium]